MDSVIKTTRQDQKVASESLLSIIKSTKAVAQKSSNTVKIKVQESGEFITVPKKALELLGYILSNMAEGKSISLIPSDSEVSTQQAADMLHVSRPHIVKLLEQGVIPFKKVGSHRRILLEDLLAYEQTLQEQRNKSLQFLAKQAQDHKLGYE